MNQLAVALDQDYNETRTFNDMKVRRSSQSALLDLFNAFGASRPSYGYYSKQDASPIVELFQKALDEDLDIAVRIALYGRDVRGGMGERKAFRDCLRQLAIHDSAVAMQVAGMVPLLGRYDDLMALFGTGAERTALRIWAKALRDGNALAAKWAPREKSAHKAEAMKLRQALGMSRSDYRKFLASRTEVVEQQMCANEWDKINYEHVPSVAAARYQKAFSTHDPEGYEKYRNSLEKGEAKINAGAVYPYDIVRSIGNGDSRVANKQWEALPDYIESDKSFIPLVDVSGSMGCVVSGSVTAMDIAISLGMYVAQRSKSEAFKNRLLTFETNPHWVDIAGLDASSAYSKIVLAGWDMSTNFTEAYRKILEAAVKNNVPQEDMPEYLIVFSDMQFDSATRGWRGESADNFVMDNIRQEFEAEGYRTPKMVFWNLNEYGRNSHAQSNDGDVALVSGFSPSMMKIILSDVESFTPFNVMLEAVMQNRYDWTF